MRHVADHRNAITDGESLIKAGSPTDIQELVKASANWSPAAKEKLAEAVQNRLAKNRHAWYCTKGRACDGQPHEGFNYRHARGDQWPPEGIDWFVWAILSGRGAGKTRTGSEWVRNITKHVPRLAMIGRRGRDVRGTMVEGDSGLIRACENAGMEYLWKPSVNEFHFENGAIAYGFSGEEPDSLRGPQFGAGWIDEPAHMPLITDVWDNLLLGMRLPGLPGGAKILATGTPLANKWQKEVVADDTTRVVRVSTYANLANLDPTFRKQILDKYEGTRKGRQELHGEILSDVEGALWDSDMFDVINPEALPDFQRIIVSIDPAGSVNKRSDETGIVVVAVAGEFGYVLEDATAKYSPGAWADKAIELYVQYSADAIIAEKNFGGDMVKQNIENNLKLSGIEARIIITHAARSKELRAEPVVGLYEKDRIFHVPGLVELEEEMTSWVPGVTKSPNRIDALVHGFTEIMKLQNKGYLPQPSRRTIGKAPAAATFLRGPKRSAPKNITRSLRRPS